MSSGQLFVDLFYEIRVRTVRDWRSCRGRQTEIHAKWCFADFFVGCVNKKMLQIDSGFDIVGQYYYIRLLSVMEI